MAQKSLVKKDKLKLFESKYTLPKYQTCFDDNLAKKYLPVIYENGCLSGPPSGVYYRIVASQKTGHYCIQYYYYWKKQYCLSTHKHDYEPIFIYIDEKSDLPYCVVNNGFSKDWRTKFHKLEIRPRHGKRSLNLQSRKTTITKSPFYPFGGNGTKKHTVWYKKYPLKGGKDLKFLYNRRPKFGIHNCSNVFSGAASALTKRRFDPPIRRLTDKVLEKWYFNNYKKLDDMPFGHDVASTFSFPFANYSDPRPKLPTPKF
jgi:hypothetical protein